MHWSPRYRSWFVTRFDDVSAALRDARFSSDRIAPFADAKLSGPDADPGLRADVRRPRGLDGLQGPARPHPAAPAAQPGVHPAHRRAALRPRIVALADELLDAVAADGSGRADLVGPTPTRSPRR